MRFASFLTALIMASCLSVVAAAQNPQLQRADALYEQYKHTDNLDALRQAIGILDGLGQDYDTSWRRARAYYSLGDDTKPHTEKLDLFQKAVDAGKKAVELGGSRAEGHYWLGVSYGGYGETKGMFKAMSLIGSIRKEMQTVVSINPGYENGGAYLVLGKMDYELPGLMGGSTKRSIEEYEQGLRVAPSNPLMKAYLAESYYDAGRKDEARSLLQQVMQINSSGSDPELRDAQKEAHKFWDKHFK